MGAAGVGVERRGEMQEGTTMTANSTTHSMAPLQAGRTSVAVLDLLAEKLRRGASQAVQT